MFLTPKKNRVEIQFVSLHQQQQNVTHFSQVSIGELLFYEPVDWSWSISTVDKDSPN